FARLPAGARLPVEPPDADSGHAQDAAVRGGELRRLLPPRQDPRHGSSAAVRGEPGDAAPCPPAHRLLRAHWKAGGSVTQWARHFTAASYSGASWGQGNYSDGGLGPEDQILHHLC